MHKTGRFAFLGILASLACVSSALAQTRPYIGYAYPAGGKQGTTFALKLGGQGMDGINDVIVTGKGVTAKIVDYHRRLNPQDMTLMGEQLRELRKTTKGASRDAMAPMMAGDAMMASGTPDKPSAGGKQSPNAAIIARLERRMAEYVQRPASVAIANLAFVEVTIAPDAPPGARELRVCGARGVSNPLVFYVGQLREYSRKPMLVSHFQVLGKESQALRKRPPEEVECAVELPCTVNGQVASGEVNKYRFSAKKGQRIVITTSARELVPYIADAVPGWFQPVISVRDASGREVAYDDDYRFKPDPVILFEAPKTGEYVLSITDAIFRGREDFVYRMTIGETPFITSIFPLGGRIGDPTPVEMKGWNLNGATLTLPPADAREGIYDVFAVKPGRMSNTVPFALDSLPEIMEREPNNDRTHPQKVPLPVMINGRIDRPDDWDVFEFAGKAGQTVVAEVYARRLGSPLDSVLTLTDPNRNILAVNDDYEDPLAGTNTHDADSYIMFKLPSDGSYYVHVGDNGRSGGEEYAYRLRISEPQPDFALRVVPSSGAMKGRGSVSPKLFVIRKDGYTGPIELSIKQPQKGFSISPTVITSTQPSVGITIKTDLPETPHPVRLVIEGRIKANGKQVVREATGAEDRMQAFLWRHLVPSQDMRVAVFDASKETASKRGFSKTAKSKVPPKPAIDPVTGKPKFTKSQVAGRIRQIHSLFEEGLLTEEFAQEKLDECEAAQ